jgi:TetR/AcrR family transcriptional regulator, mexJK operon transcriptional repressor
MNAPHEIGRQGRKVAQVLEGARAIFMRDGFEGASVDEIAREAGVSKATLYSYFPDKRLLFMEVAKLECARQAETACDSRRLVGSPAEVLYETASRMTRFFISDFGQQVFRMCVAESHRFPELGREFYASGPMLLRTMLVEYLTESVARGDLVIDDIELAADQFPELCKASLHAPLVFGVKTSFTDEEIDRVIRGAVDVFMARYGAKG